MFKPFGLFRKICRSLALLAALLSAFKGVFDVAEFGGVGDCEWEEAGVFAFPTFGGFGVVGGERGENVTPLWKRGRKGRKEV